MHKLSLLGRATLMHAPLSEPLRLAILQSVLRSSSLVAMCLAVPAYVSVNSYNISRSCLLCWRPGKLGGLTLTWF